MIHIIDYGIGNLRSIEKAVEHVGAEVVRSDRIEDILRADKLILPGVGAFGACIDELRRRNLEEPIKAAAGSGKPLLGVCIGLQMLFGESQEMGLHKGLNLLPGRVVRFSETPARPEGASIKTAPATRNRTVSQRHAVPGDPRDESTVDSGPATGNAKPETLKIPHMGWNQVFAAYSGHPLLEDVENGAHFYFVHSYHVEPTEESDVLGICDYGGAFAAMVARKNILGVQFHPEKSQDAGLQVLNNFVKLTADQLV